MGGGPARAAAVEARVDDVVDVVHGIEVADPYRWLEDGTAPDTRAWAGAQNARTRAALDAIPARPRLRSRLDELLRAGVSAAPSIRGDLVFSLDRWGEHDQAVLVTRPLGPAGPHPPTVVLDPAALTGDPTAAIDWYHPSLDGLRVAYGMSTGGDERSTLRVIETATGEHHADEIPSTRAASVAWAPDGRSFRYTRYATGGDYDRYVFRHELGAPWEDDEVVFDRLPDPTAWPDVACSRDGRWVLVHVATGWSRVDVHLLDATNGAWRTLIEGADVVTSLGFDEERDRLVGSTTLGADRGQVIAIDPAGSSVEPETWRTLVPENEAVLEAVAPTLGGLLVVTGHRAVSTVRRHDPEGTLIGDVALPAPASLAGLAVEEGGDRAAISVTGFTQPATMYLLNAATGVAEQWSELPGGPDPAVSTIEHTEYRSTDGTVVPAFIVRPVSGGGAEGEATGALPMVLTGYGGFAVTMSPAYSPLAALLTELGAGFAVACIRGGLEEGEAWHRAGMRANKQKVFDDFTAAVDWLVGSGATTRDRLAIRGGSNGGLLVAACMTQRPDLCRAVICAVPLTDMVRFPQFLIAKLWVPEYGDPEEADEFAWLWAYSPYHRVVDGTCYPATLITTGEEDSRVDPAHARKFGARLQAATSCGDDRPILVRVETRAGHGQGKPASAQAEEAADVAAFLVWQLSIQVA